MVKLNYIQFNWTKLNHGLNINYKVLNFICQIFKYLFWQVKKIYLILFGIFFRKCNFDWTKNCLESINMIVLKFIINIHNYHWNVYYNYNDNQFFIYIWIGIIYLNFIIYVKILM
jgi:hypothetical protein